MKKFIPILYFLIFSSFHLAYADSLSIGVDNHGNAAMGVVIGNPPPPVIIEREVIREPGEDERHFESRHRAWEKRHREQLKQSEERKHWEKNHARNDHHEQRDEHR